MVAFIEILIMARSGETGIVIIKVSINMKELACVRYAA